MGRDLIVVICRGGQKDLRKFNIDKRNYYYGDSDKYETIEFGRIYNNYYLSDIKLTRRALVDYINFLKNKYNFYNKKIYYKITPNNEPSNNDASSSKVIYSHPISDNWIIDINEDYSQMLNNLQETIVKYEYLIWKYNFYGIISIIE